MQRLKSLINLDGDTILHQAAYLGEHKLRDRHGEALHAVRDTMVQGPQF